MEPYGAHHQPLFKNVFTGEYTFNPYTEFCQAKIDPETKERRSIEMPYHSHPGLAARGILETAEGTLAGPSQMVTEDPAHHSFERVLSRIQKEIENAQRLHGEPPRFPPPITKSSVLQVPEEISHPKHYCRGGIECRHVIDAWELSYNLGTALAYICRAYHKGAPDKDIAKAIQHLQFELEICMRKKQRDPEDFGPRGSGGTRAETRAAGATTCSRHLGYMPGA